MTKSLIPFGMRLGLFDEFSKEVNDMMGRFFTVENGSELSREASWVPRLNFSETDEHYDVTFDLPGIKPDEVNVELCHGDLWITGERKAQSEEKGKSWHRVERHYGQFRRVVRLGDDIDSSNVDAEYKDGVLRITVSKTEQARTKKIEIKS